MKTFFKDLFEYHNHFNQKLADLLMEHSNKISERSIPLFSHMMNAHHIWNSRIAGGDPVGVNDTRTLEANKDIDNSNFQVTLQILEQQDIDRVVHYQNSRGDKFSNTVQDMLFQVANHHTHHRAQIISDLRQNGITPIVTDYIFYKR